MNAHINRDFPFILYHAGLADPDGTSRKPQHDSYNSRLRALYKPVIDEMTRRFDPSMDDYDVPGTTADDEVLFSVLVGWRETAWQNAKRLAAAKTDAERRQVAASIEAYALSQAELIYAGTVYAPGETTAARDAQCAAHGGQRPSYRRGADVARFASKSIEPGRAAGTGWLPIRCPNGPGPCSGTVASRPLTHRVRFSVPAGESRRLRLSFDDGRAGGRARVRLTAMQGPGENVVKARSLELP
jgi:hypothetical protein